MSTINKVIIVGRLGKDPELRMTSNGQQVCNISVATSEKWVKDDVKEERTEWHNVVLWGKLAQTVADYMKKGSLGYFEGKIRTKKWTDPNTNLQRYGVDILASSVVFLDNARSKVDQDDQDMIDDNSSSGEDVPF